MIRVKPTEGQLMIIGKSWFTVNEFFAQYFPEIKPSKVYKILKVSVEDPDFPDDWGISAIQDITTEEIFDIANVPELDDYWALFDKDDNIRTVEI